MQRIQWLMPILVLAARASLDGTCLGRDDQTNTPIVHVESGLLRGLATNGVVVFLGVPYAEPPVGSLRWVAPQPAKPWSGVRDATRVGFSAAQGTAEVATSNEDCLYLNVTAPPLPAQGARRPVMVWLHGGGFSGGTANSYDPRRMVLEGGVVVVTVEFRLNVFGFFGFPGLEDSGAFGLLDQQAALGWIKRNISAVEGDPGNVTLFGESGGGIAACAHLTSPGAKGLFQKLILQSGAVTTSWPPHSPLLWPHGSFWLPVQEIESAGENLAVKMGCPAPKGSPEALQWLRQQSTAALLKHSALFGIAGYGGRVLPRHPVQALAAGEFAPVPVISGFTRDEGRGLALGMQLMGGGQPMAEQTYRELIGKSFGERVQEIEAEYPLSQYASPGLAWAAIYTDRMFAYPQIAATRTLATRASAYAYEFADTNAPGLLPFFPGFDPGASHSGELPFLFDVENKPIDMTGKQVPLTERQTVLALTMVRYWIHFAQSGDPNGQGTPRWPPFRAQDAAPEIQVLATGPNGVGPGKDVLRRHHCGFWERLTR